MSSIFDFTDNNSSKEYMKRKSLMSEKINCHKCGLYKWPKTPRMEPSGPPNADYYLLGEEPGEQEDVQGRQFYEKAESGKYLRSNMRAVGLNPARWRMGNSIRCRKPGNVKPTDAEIDLCRPRVLSDICITKPRVILLFGGCALKSVIGESGIGRFRGRIIPYHDLNAWVCPLVHPSGVKRDLHTNELIFEDDLRRVSKLIKSEKKIPKTKPFKIEAVTNGRDICRFLEWLNHKKRIAIDFETVNFRPYYANSKLVSAAVTVDGVTAVSFPVEKTGELVPKQRKRVITRLKKVLRNINIKKIVHNFGMEGEWSEAYLKTKMLGRVDDTQRMSYAFDVRHKCHSLAFITLVNFGVRWKDIVAKYKKNMDACPTPLLLDYGGEDVVWTFRNYEYYTKIFKRESKLYKMYKELLIEGAKACVAMQVGGVFVDTDYLNSLDKNLTSEIKNQVKKLRTFKSVKKYERHKGRRVNFNSDDQIKDILYGKQYLDLEVIKKTGKGNVSVDAGVLEQHADKGVKLCKSLMKYGELTHLKSTSIDGIYKVLYNGSILHPQFHNAFTRTGRLSSSDPNMQNFPSRKNKHVRSMVIPPKGYVIAGADYSQIEAVGIAIESGDRNFKQALANKYDIHYDKAADIYGKKYAEEKRKFTKNAFVFPTFYGAGAESTSVRIGKSVRETQRHIDKLWKDFPEIKEYQQRQIEFYKKNLYVESRSGRRRYGPLEVTKIINTPIQALASDFTIRSMIILLKRGYWIFGNEHDALYFYLPERTLDRDLVRIKRVMVTLPEEWVDDVEVKVGMEIGYDWGSLEKVAI